MADRPLHVLFLCTGNSVRSILAEQLVNHWGRGKFRGFSAGSHPKGQVHPIAIDLLKQMKLPTEGLRSKSWDEFAAAGAPPIDFVFTVCDNAAGEVCPIWPGQPMTAHWGVDDPAAVQGSDTDQWLAFRQSFKELESRIRAFTSLPIQTLESDQAERTTRRHRHLAHGRTGVTMMRRLVAEGLGSLLLAATVVGSGIMAERLAGGNAAVALLGNTAATVAVLVALIELLRPVSGAHFNPAVTLAVALRGGMSAAQASQYILMQVAGCCAGAVLANLMFELPPVQVAAHVRTGFSQWIGEFVATFGLLLIVLGYHRAHNVAVLVSTWIGAAYWFTSSTSFSNPAITLARSLSDTFSGIRPTDVLPFVLAQLTGAGCALVLASWLFPNRPSEPYAPAAPNPTASFETRVGGVSSHFNE